MEYDNDTGLSYANARYYDGNTGRFISQDPAFLLIGDKKKFEEKYDRILQSHLTDPQSLNSYSYVNNNPIKYTDPDGEIIPLIIAGAAAVWAVTEVALSAYDIYNAGKTVANPNASWTDKGISVVGAGIGIIAPGGGYGKAGQSISKIIPNISRNNLPSYAKNTLNFLEKNGFKNPIRGYKGGGIFENRDKMLPPRNDPRYYREWDIKPLQSGVNRGVERIVTGKNGEVYWTDTHYGQKPGMPFSRIK